MPGLVPGIQPTESAGASGMMDSGDRRRNDTVRSVGVATPGFGHRQSRGGDLLYLFEDYALDTERRELRRGQAPVAIEPKVFDLLAFVIENRQRVVSRDDLIAQVWDGRIVSESALARCISEARSAIGDDGEAQRLIKTLPRKGLRFVGAVREERQPSGVAEADARPEKPAPLPLPDKPSIAVLAFTNMSGDPGQDYFSDGITEDIITGLSRFSELFVIARNSSFQYKGRSPDIRQVGRELGVRYVLEGSIRRAGDRVRISAQLVDAVTGAHRWAERYDRELKDVFAVQDEVSRAIVATLVAQVDKAEAERTLLKPPETWQAYDFFMRASAIYSAFRLSFNVADLYEARQLLDRSISLDPNYARAYAMLSSTHLLAWTYALDEDHLSPTALGRAHRLARKAVELDPNLPIAHAHLGYVLTFQGQHEQSIAEFEKAMALNPNFTDWRFGIALNRSGHPARAAQVVETHMRYDPFYAPAAPGVLGLARYMLKQYSETLPPMRECTSRAPNFRSGHVWLAANLAQLGRLDEARAEAAEVLRIEPKYTIDGTERRLFLHKAENAEHLFDGLRKAGLPER
jgi:adenylate cyclase